MESAHRPQLLTVLEASEWLRLSEKTVREHCVSGEIPATKIGRRWFINAARLEELLAGAPSPQGASAVSLPAEELLGAEG